MSKAVWKILDGVGDAVDGTVEEISAFLFERLNKQAEGGEVITDNVLLLKSLYEIYFSSSDLGRRIPVHQLLCQGY